MNFDTFLDNHWDVFISHICEFHQIESDLIKEFNYELDWISISKNQKLNWTLEFLETYENNFMWHELAWNPGISWSTDLIKKFNKRLDWYYLGRNINLPISEEFIEEHKKKIFIIESNLFLNEQLKKVYNKNLLPALRPRPDYVSIGDLVDINKILKDKNKRLSPNSKVFYENYIQKELSNRSLNEIFKNKFDYSQRYFFMRPIQNDEYGLTPEFVIDGKNPFQHLQNNRNILKINENLVLINGSLQEGKARLLEMPRFATFSFSPILLVSENVKTILEKHNLPEHSFTSVDLKPKRINTNNKFYLFQMNHDTLTKDLDYDKIHFFYRTKDGILDSQATYSDWEKVETSNTKNYSALIDYFGNLRKELKNDVGKSIEYLPSKFVLKTSYDIYSYTVHNKFIVTEHLKNELEKFIPNQIGFRSAQLLKIEQEQELYNQMLNRKFDFEGKINPIKYTNASEDLYYFEKMHRLEETDTLFPNELQKNDEFKEIEQKLKVILPEKFKRNYRKRKIDEGYELLPISEFYIQNEYAERLPETYKSLIFAENGCGDSLGLILDKESDYKLKPQIYEFLHETGEVEKK